MLSSRPERGPLKYSFRRAFVVGTAATFLGLILSLSQRVLDIEQSLSLNILYGLRGNAVPPANVIVVSLSQDSAEQLGLSEALATNVELTGWPRSLHGQLLDLLSALGARVVAFDIHFQRPGDPAVDSGLAAAMQRAGSVILLEELRREIDLPEDTNLPFQIIVDSSVPPLALFDNAALASAAFPLPDLPKYTSQFWAFLTNASGKASLPTLAYLAWARQSREALLEHLAVANPAKFDLVADSSLEQEATNLHKLLVDDESVTDSIRSFFSSATDLSSDTSRQMTSLLNLLSGPDSRYLNFYGPPRSIKTVPVHDLLQGTIDQDIDWSEAIVFVGLSERTQPTQTDDFLSFYSQRSGLNLSGVEIAATAAANFVDGSALVPLSISIQLGVVTAFGLLLGLVFGYPKTLPVLLVTGLILSGYVVFANYQFGSAHIWWPIVTPGLAQTPIAILLGIFLLNRQAERSKAQLARGASRFIPREFVDRMSAGNDLPQRSSTKVYGTCMMTDLEHFTAYSERITLTQLEQSLNTYYEQLFSVVTDHGGLVTDIVGDSMVAVWRSAQGDALPSEQAVRAAISLQRSLASGSRDFPRTRVGISAGEFILGTIGASEHLEYRAVGDVVNSADRIQALNKVLQTTVLVARDALPRGNLVFRDIGSFILPGRTSQTDIFEPIEPDKAADSGYCEFVARFQSALAKFRARDWDSALNAFQLALEFSTADGPTRFYIALLEQHIANATTDQLDSVIAISS